MKGFFFTIVLLKQTIKNQRLMVNESLTVAICSKGNVFPKYNFKKSP